MERALTTRPDDLPDALRLSSWMFDGAMFGAGAALGVELASAVQAVYLQWIGSAMLWLDVTMYLPLTVLALAFAMSLGSATALGAVLTLRAVRTSAGPGVAVALAAVAAQVPVAGLLVILGAPWLSVLGSVAVLATLTAPVLPWATVRRAAGHPPVWTTSVAGAGYGLVAWLLLQVIVF